MDKYGLWIPPEILSIANLTWQEKSVLALIHNLSNDEGCFATNRYIGEYFGIGVNRTSRIISSLKEKGYLVSHKKQSTLSQKCTRHLALSNIDICTNQTGGIAQKSTHNKYNNKNINKKLYIKKTQFNNYSSSKEISEFEKLMLKKRVERTEANI